MITIDFKDKRPIYEQIINKVEELVSCGCYTAGQQLPSVRQLAFELSINPNTIQKAYTELERLKIIITLQSRGSFITDDLSAIKENKKNHLFNEFDSIIRKLLEIGLSTAQLTEHIKSHDKQGGKIND